MSLLVTNVYTAHTAMLSLAAPFQQTMASSAVIAEYWAEMMKNTPYAAPYRVTHAFCDVAARSFANYDRRPFGIESVVINGEEYYVKEEIVKDKPFMREIQFGLVDKNGEPIKRNVPNGLLIAPKSGHFSTLLRGTVERLLVDCDVTITDWKNVRNIPASAGRFDITTYKDYLKDTMRRMGRKTHVIAVCQPAPLTMAAIAEMAEDGDPAQPLSMTLMGGPIHPSANITQPAQLAKDNDITFFENLTGTVPFPYDGQGRQVYPGIMQLAAFIMMNYDRHADGHKDYFENLTRGDGESAKKHRKFYDEYLAVMDMTAEFYLQTIEEIFQKESLANGTLELGRRLIDPGKITKTALMTVEGELDDIAAPLQTTAAHDLTPNIPNHMKYAHLEPEAGHYGIFNGGRWRDNIAPRVIDMMHRAGQENSIEYDAPSAKKRAMNWDTAQKTVYASYQADNAPTLAA